MSTKGISRRSLLLAAPALWLPSKLSALSAAQGCRMIPGQAYDAGFRNLVFFDDFLSMNTIDARGTGAPGFNWYTRQFSGSNITIPVNPTPGSWLSVKNSILTIATNQPSDGGFQIQSVGYAGKNNYVKGFTLTPGNGAYLEVSAQFNPALSYGAGTGSQPWPLPLWMQDLNGTLSQVNGTSLAHFVEFDIAEFYATGVGTAQYDVAAHDWTSSGATDTNNQVNVIPLSGAPSNWNTYGMLWQTQVGTGGNGLVRWFFNGAGLQPVLAYSSSTGSSPAATPSNPSGVFSSADSDSFVLFMNAGNPNWYLNVDYVAVWQ